MFESHKTAPVVLCPACEVAWALFLVSQSLARVALRLALALALAGVTNVALAFEAANTSLVPLQVHAGASPSESVSASEIDSQTH